ncbi:MAG: hypothetical protein ACKVU1_11990 [bacterium]
MSVRAAADAVLRALRIPRIALACTLSAASCVAFAPAARAEPRGLVIDAGTGVGSFRPRDVANQLTRVESDRVTSTMLDLGVVARPYDRVGLALEFGYGRSWNGSFTQTSPSTTDFEDVVCKIDLEARDYLRFNGAVIVDLAGGSTRPFVVAGGGAWVFLEKEARSTVVCSDGTGGGLDVNTVSSPEEPLLILGGGVRFRDSARVSVRCDYRANIIFEDDGESVVNQVRVGVLFAPKG